LALDDSVRRCVSVDALRFKQVLSNLLSNAIKFTDEGSVGISASTRPAGQDAILLHLSVRDSGIGISAADQDRLFAPFTQVVAPGHA
ncbi:ATP-binding protein, partial [Paraburkholderia sp. SIMBA_030]